ncbi:hypothetical protein UFOVP210_7 [uncultured Caudovirales phage]|uniref:Uncharacterized protein n=1 Tax=uncultured Caudovirales phage TaxID=2100421 RepID=A0A6J7WIW2_9CAUD|nr:hypothetical protein UFOVP210_7 [uncultured Caudovirales phage]
MDTKIRPLPLIEHGTDIPATTYVAGTSDILYFQVSDRNASPYDITSGTVTSSLVNSSTGVAVTLTGTTTAKVTNVLGLVSFSGYTWVTGTYNYYITWVNAGITRIFGPYRVEVEAL